MLQHVFHPIIDDKKKRNAAMESRVALGYVAVATIGVTGHCAMQSHVALGYVAVATVGVTGPCAMKRPPGRRWISMFPSDHR